MKYLLACFVSLHFAGCNGTEQGIADPGPIGATELEVIENPHADNPVLQGFSKYAEVFGLRADAEDGLTDEQVLMCPDIMSTGFAGAEAAKIKIGDIVAIFAQGPIGLCATAGARLRGAGMIIVVDGVDARLDIARQMGADVTLNFKQTDVVEEILRLTGGRGVDASIEALGQQSTFESALRVLKPGGTLSSLGVYSADLTIPLGAFHAGLGDHKIVTSLCPGGKERMRRLLNVVASGRVDLAPLVTHHYALDDITNAYELFANQRDGVLKVAIKP